MPIKINGVNHFAISVADLEESLAWYERVFGFRVLDRSEIPGTGVRVSHMQAPGFLLEVFCAPGSNPLPEDRKIPNRDFLTQGNKHISFGVPDAHALLRSLSSWGFTWPSSPRWTAPTGVHQRQHRQPHRDFRGGGRQNKPPVFAPIQTAGFGV